VVTKVPDYCIDEVSDHAMALLLALVRKIPFANTRVHAGRWEMKAVVPVHRLRGSVLGLVGFGRIPQLVAPKAKAFGLRVALTQVRHRTAETGESWNQRSTQNSQKPQRKRYSASRLAQSITL
jgi:D-3-phosphoglycerate dehydrogenase